MNDDPIPPRVPPRRPPAVVPPAMPPKPAPAAIEAASKASVPGDTIVAKGSADYRIRRYLMTLLLIAGGIWFAYDGWKGWPDENRKIKELNEQLNAADKAGDHDAYSRIKNNPLTDKKSHTDLDIRWQKNLAFILPIGGVLFLIWTLYNSRGEYRLEGTALSVPGHPTIQLSEITEIDKSKWDRKGIAYIHYATANGSKAKLKLDDFVYQQQPTDDIFKRLEDFVGSSEVLYRNQSVQEGAHPENQSVKLRRTVIDEVILEKPPQNKPDKEA